LADKRLLVVSNETGEGAFVSDVAGRGVHPVPTLIRGSKLIAYEDWNGRNSRINFSSPSLLLRELEDLHVDFLVVDESVTLAYTPFVRQMLATHPERFERVLTVQGGRRLTVHRLVHATPGPAKRVTAEIAALRQVLTRP
jgi:hypothetical protein